MPIDARRWPLIDSSAAPHDARRALAGSRSQRVDYVLDALAKLRDIGLGMILVEEDVLLALDFAVRGDVLETGSIRAEGPGQSLLKGEAIAAAHLRIAPEDDAQPVRRQVKL